MIEKMYKFLLLVATISFSFQNSFAQLYPPYQITSYDTASSGYYFLSTIKLGILPGGISQYHMILDGRGDVVYYRAIPNGQRTQDFKLHDNGWMSYGLNAKFYIMDSTFMVIDSLVCKNGISTDNHEMQILPNGHYMMLGLETITMDLSGYSLFGPNHVPGSTTALVKSGVIQELDQNKNVVFEWHAIDHFNFTDTDPNLLTDPNVVDWTHCNAIELDWDGNLLLSSRNFNEITKINRQDSSVIWRMGGNANQFTFLNDPLKFKRQHDIRRLANGHITLFDNGDGPENVPFHFASAKEYVINETAKTIQKVWSYADDYSEYSTAMGNFQRVPGGNSVICYGNSSSQNKVFSAVNETGQKVFQIEFDYNLSSYRAFNYQTLPFELHRPTITCFESSGSWFLDAGSGYSDYQWTNGQNAQVIQVTDTGTFTVFVPYGQGGFISSESIVVTNVSDPCGLTSLNESAEVNFSIGPNPANDFITVNFNSASKTQKFRLELYSVSGMKLNEVNTFGKQKVKMPVTHLAPGVYFLRYGEASRKFVKF